MTDSAPLTVGIGVICVEYSEPSVKPGAPRGCCDAARYVGAVCGARAELAGVWLRALLMKLDACLSCWKSTISERRKVQVCARGGTAAEYAERVGLGRFMVGDQPLHVASWSGVLPLFLREPNGNREGCFEALRGIGAGSLEGSSACGGAWTRRFADTPELAIFLRKADQSAAAARPALGASRWRWAGIRDMPVFD